jgi:hypothetical protein
VAVTPASTETHHDEHGGADGDQAVRSEPRHPLPPLALQPDHSAQEDRAEHPNSIQFKVFLLSSTLAHASPERRRE